MQRLFSIFPAGWPGAGLGLARITVSLSSIVWGANIFLLMPNSAAEWTLGFLAILAGMLLLIGFLTPIAGMCLAAGNFSISILGLQVVSGSVHETAIPSCYLAVLSIVIVLVGPGAFSVDARLFGRREIIIPSASERSDS